MGLHFDPKPDAVLLISEEAHRRHRLRYSHVIVSWLFPARPNTSLAQVRMETARASPNCSHCLEQTPPGPCDATAIFLASPVHL